MESQISSLRGKTEVCEQLRISPRALEMMIKQNLFPPPVRIGKCVYWSETAIQNWYRGRFDAQENWRPGAAEFAI